MIIEIINADKMCYDAKVEIVPRVGEYVHYSSKDGNAIEGVVVEVAHSLSIGSQSISVFLKPLQSKS